MRCEIAVDIDSCPEHVWAVLIDLGRWPRWTAAVRDATLVGGGTLSLGAVARLRAPRLPERTWHVRDFQPRRHRLALHGEGLGGRASVRFALARAETASRTRLVVVHERSGWLGTPMARLTARTTEAHLQTLTGDLKAHCEARRRAGVATATV
jgi:hypothetical protein